MPMMRTARPPVSLPNAIPRAALVGAGLLVVTALALVIGARLTGYSPAKPAPVAVVGIVEMQFEDRADGAVLVHVLGAEPSEQVLPPGTNGFVRGVLRGLARERRADHITSQAPFRLTRWADGRLSLDDPATGRHVDLEVFGPANAGAFAAIFTEATTHERQSP